MNEIIFDNQILHLTDKFYQKYPSDEYNEILIKNERPYNCLLLQSSYGYFICIPYRTEISHKYAYKFTSSERSRRHKSGLDYTKIVIISENEYVDDHSALIDSDEYKETMTHIKRITREANKFVEDYIKHCKGEQILHPSEYNRRYRFSPLKYFHKELHI